jgi:phosphohistidine phosphatase
MRRLLLLRHAKAAPAGGDDDYARALTERGREDARRIGDMIGARGLVPDIMIYSSAERTRETAEIVAANWPRRVESVADHGLYEATRHFLLERARAAPDRAGVVMIVGHNPGIGELAALLVGGGAEPDRKRMGGAFPTSGLAVLDFDRPSWSEIAPHSARLVRFVAASDWVAPRV